MCGIAGILGQTAERIHLDKMLDRIYHRGPDGVGEFIDTNVYIGMRRLAVIDVEHGWQPIKSRNERVIAFQNGEIYNYRQLRRELEACGQIFTTNSDTEVLAHGYATWGWKRLLERIDGMYAIAIFDRDSRMLHLARDRFGEKPLFYTITSNAFAYASSVKSLATLEWVDRSIDLAALDKYLALHYVPGERTIFNAIKRLLPGHELSINVDNLQSKISRYYELRLTYPRERSVEEIVNAVEDAVSSRLVADVPVGVFLSGGIDSSIIAAIAVKQNPSISTYSIGFPDSAVDESKHAAVVASHIGSAHHTFHFDNSKFIELLPQVAAALDEPIGDQATLPLFWLCNEARKEVTVVLSGEGADELFGGYGYYAPMAAPTEWPRKYAWITESGKSVVPELLGNRITASGFPILAGAAERARMICGSVPDASWCWEVETNAMLTKARCTLQRATAADIAGWLPDDLLVKLDRIGMAHSLEGRAPFLAPTLVEMALNLPAHQRIQNDQTKVALRKVAQRLLPIEIVGRPKQGFVLPMGTWLRDWFRHQGDIKSYIASAAMPGIDAQAVADIIEEDLNNGVKRERLLFAIIILMEWWKNFD
jgi:asparagine synthase (glutamine-hydrolysing)